MSAPRRGPARLTEVAKHAGVSLATASRVLNGSDRTVGEPHRARVLAAADELGYRANLHAQAIARGPATSSGWSCTTSPTPTSRPSPTASCASASSAA